MRFLVLISLLISVVVAKSKIQFAVGDVFLNSKKARVGQVVKSGDTLKTIEGSYLDVKLSSGTGFRIKENSILVVELESLEKIRLNSTKGSILSIVRKGVDYQVKAATATAAVRGTIFFMDDLETGETSFCTCNGHVEFSNAKGDKKSLIAAHHKAGSFDEKGEFFGQGMSNHSDEDVFNLMFNLNQEIVK
jgi:hypothetical protein